ncbi:MAG: glucose-1-phosphate adenylyltransferase [Chloroflexi bacterium]|nr:glucose-1-phosphate adenylyltransferase [Chloroflexota bacterium]
MAVRNVAAIILAGGQGERLSVLSAQRAKPAVPFAGKYRIIDFTLFHDEHKADVTVAVMQVPMEEAHRFGTLVAAADGRVVGFEERPPQPQSNLISMGIYVFDRDVLVRRLEEDARIQGSKRDFGRDLVPRMVEVDRVFAYPFRGYWRDVGTIQSYWDSNMGLLNEPPDFDLYDTDWVIHTRSEERPPARITDQGRILRSLISHGSIINGAVEHSVLSPGVFVAEGAVVRDSILFPDCIVGPGSLVDRAILDKNVVVGADVRLGEGNDTRPNRSQPRNLQTGITVVGKGARIPTGLRIGRNCLISADVIERDFTRFLASNGHVRAELPSGETVDVASREAGAR